MIDQIKNVKKKVKQMLLEFPETRDNDNLLIMKVWLDQQPSMRKKEFMFKTFAIAFVNGAFCNPESIRRSRALLQNKYPELRGESWYKRQNLGEQTRLDINS